MKLNNLISIALGFTCLPALAGQPGWIVESDQSVEAQLNACARPDLAIDAPLGNGFVMVLFRLTKDGKVAQAEVTRPSGSAAVDGAALRALEKCELKAPALAGKWQAAGYAAKVTPTSIKPTAASATPETIASGTVVPPPAPPIQRKPAQVNFATCHKPIWPKQALREEQTGTVTLRFLIGVDGTVHDSEVLLTSGYPLLDFAALEGIERCRFKPATANGVPQAGWQRMQYVWTLEGDPKEDSAILAGLQSGIEQGKADARYQMALYQLKGGNSLIAKDGVAALQALLPLAEAGMADAQEALGVAYLTGNGTVRDPARAVRWLRKAAEHNFSSAQFALARLLQVGEGTPRNEKEAFEWYGKAGRGGIEQAYLAMAEMMLDSGDAATTARAVEWLQKMTMPAARYMLGERFELGRGVAPDLQRARELYRSAAQGGHVRARQALLRLGEPLPQ
ncbi:TonB family protein [Pseudoduganella sp.]|uniref:TonB family protein n=1 Tax=Pseudoduganella sp. TaxID=1880898 RepID=UPI0035AF572C